jgi:hypothetical protein
MIKTIFKERKIDIIIGVIASFIVLFILNFQYTLNQFLYFGNILSSWYINYIFRVASKNEHNIYVYIISILFGLGIYFILYILSYRKKAKEIIIKVDKYKNKPNNDIKEKNIIDIKKEIEETSSIDKIGELSEKLKIIVSEINNKCQIDNLDNDIKFVRCTYRLLSITPLFIIIFLLTFILADFFPSMMSEDSSFILANNRHHSDVTPIVIPPPRV